MRTLVPPDRNKAASCSCFRARQWLASCRMASGRLGTARGSMSAFKNEDRIAAIDTLTNKVIATSPIGQAPQAVVYVPNAIPVVSNHGAEVPGRTGRDHQIAALHLAHGPPCDSLDLFPSLVCRSRWPDELRDR